MSEKRKNDDPLIYLPRRKACFLLIFHNFNVNISYYFKALYKMMQDEKEV